MNQTFEAVVQFTDTNGLHEAGSPVALPANSDTDLQEISTLLNYGVIRPLTED